MVYSLPHLEIIPIFDELVVLLYICQDVPTLHSEVGVLNSAAITALIAASGARSCYHSQYGNCISDRNKYRIDTIVTDYIENLPAEDVKLSNFQIVADLSICNGKLVCL